MAGWLADLVDGWVDGWMKIFGEDTRFFTFTISLIRFSPLRNKISLPAKADENPCVDNIYNPFSQSRIPEKLGKKHWLWIQPFSLSHRWSRWACGHRNHSWWPGYLILLIWRQVRQSHKIAMDGSVWERAKPVREPFTCDWGERTGFTAGRPSQACLPSLFQWQKPSVQKNPVAYKDSGKGTCFSQHAITDTPVQKGGSFKQPSAAGIERQNAK